MSRKFRSDFNFQKGVSIFFLRPSETSDVTPPVLSRSGENVTKNRKKYFMISHKRLDSKSLSVALVFKRISIGWVFVLRIINEWTTGLPAFAIRNQKRSWMELRIHPSAADAADRPGDQERLSAAVADKVPPPQKGKTLALPASNCLFLST